MFCCVPFLLNHVSSLFLFFSCGSPGSSYWMIFRQRLPCESNIKSMKFNDLTLANLHFLREYLLLALDHQISQTKDCLWSYRLRSWLRLMMDPVHIPASHAAGYPVAFSRRWLEKWHRRSGGRCPMTGAALDLKEMSFGECPAGWRLSVRDKVSSMVSTRKYSDLRIGCINKC